MSKKVKTIMLSVGMFIAGIVASYIVFINVIAPDMMTDFEKLLYEGGTLSYSVGWVDGANGSTELYDEYFAFSEEELNEIENWEYKYIK